MRLRLQQEENWSRANQIDEPNSDLLWEMRKEMDELRNSIRGNSIRGKTDRSLDSMVRATDSPFTTTVLECPVPSKF